MTAEALMRTGRKGIPNHPLEFRREIALLASVPGVSVLHLAMEHGLNTNLVFKCRRALQVGEYDPADLLLEKIDTPAAEGVPPASITEAHRQGALLDHAADTQQHARLNM